MKTTMSCILAASLLFAGCASTTGGGGASGAAQGATSQVDVQGRDHPLKTWLKSQSRAKRGALLGGLTGALAGAFTAARMGKNPLAGAVVGGAAGALAGFLIGKRKDTIYGSRDEAIARLGWDPSQGYVIKVEEVRFDPANLKPGATVEAYARYVVVGPDPHEDITVNAFTGVKYDGDYVMGDGPHEFVVPQGGGIIETRCQLTIPSKAPTGSYVIEALFDDPNGRFQTSGEGPLYVT
jgi:Glycine zipper